MDMPVYERFELNHVQIADRIASSIGKAYPHTEFKIIVEPGNRFNTATISWMNGPAEGRINQLAKAWGCLEMTSDAEFIQIDGPLKLTPLGTVIMFTRTLFMLDRKFDSDRDRQLFDFVKAG